MVEWPYVSALLAFTSWQLRLHIRKTAREIRREPGQPPGEYATVEQYIADLEATLPPTGNAAYVIVREEIARLKT